MIDDTEQQIHDTPFDPSTEPADAEVASTVSDTASDHEEQSDAPHEETEASLSDKEQQSSFVPAQITSSHAPMPTFGQLGVALGMLVLVFGVSYIPGLTDRNIPDRETQPAVQPEVLETSDNEKDPFTNVAIEAKAAYVWDVKNQRALYNKNAGTQLPLASLTKLMTALVAYEHLAADEQVQITLDAILQEGDSNLSYGEQFTAKALADFVLLSSSNDGAYALAAAAGAALAPDQNPEAVFIEAMNIRAESIGLSQSYFMNSTGLDVDAHTSGSYGSARDMAFLMEYLVINHPEIIESTKRASGLVYDQFGSERMATNTNEIATEIPGLIGSKTGYTDLAGGNLVVAFDAGLNRPIIISVLGSTREGRFSDMQKLITRTQRALINETAYGN